MIFIVAATAFAAGIASGWALSYRLGIINIMNRIVIVSFSLGFEAGFADCGPSSLGSLL